MSSRGWLRAVPGSSRLALPKDGLSLEPSPPLVILGSGKPSPADALCRFLHGNDAGLTWWELGRVSVMVRASDGGLQCQERFALQRG